ncbi:hypothetical protein D5086_030028 [Populus alba]|uniref:Uncharacterized protein n=1 Tax=Populus alba TaxID=43335 RepID=A0ACC4AMC9_POPAL
MLFMIWEDEFQQCESTQGASSGAIGTLIKIGVLGGLGLYGATNSLYNVDGGHRAIMFNRIAAKQVAARDAERAKFIVEKAEQDKKSAVIRAEGEATSAQLIGQAIANNPAFITLRKIEAAREIAHTISNSANKVFLDSSDLLLNLQKMELENPRNK